MRNPLKLYRDEQQLSQQEVAGLLGVSRQMVGFLENGERPFTPEMALLMEQRLGIARERVRPDFFKRQAA